MAAFLPSFLLFIAISAGCRGQQINFSGNEEVVLLRSIHRLPSELIESSGIEVSGSNRIWSHEDSGNGNELFCFDTLGNLLRTLIISNVSNIDWEDITADNDETWFIGDFGNNNNQRTDLAIYIIPDPETIPENTVAAGIINFSLSDQLAFPPPSSGRNYDVEAMAWYADSLYLFTKDRSNPFTGIVKMYVLPDKPGTFIARLAGSFVSGNTTGNGRVTAADINLHTGELILLTNEKLISFSDYPGNHFFEGSRTEYFFNVLPGQNEGLAFVSSNKLYMTEEGSGSTPGFLYEIILPSPQSAENELTSLESLYVYPNPGNEVIKFSLQIDGRADVYSAAGILVKTVWVVDGTIDISLLKPGIYFLSATLKQTPFFIPFQKI
jgi:hypothetical protein